MFDPTRPVMTPAQLADHIGGSIPNTDHPLATCLVIGADGTDVRCNVKDFDPTIFQLSPNTPVVPPNAPADFKRAENPVPNYGAPAAPAAPVAPASSPVAGSDIVAPPYVYEGSPQVFTMQNGLGYFRSDSMGRRLNPTDFATKEEAAASPVTINGYTGEPLNA